MVRFGTYKIIFTVRVPHVAFAIIINRLIPKISTAFADNRRTVSLNWIIGVKLLLTVCCCSYPRAPPHHFRTNSTNKLKFPVRGEKSLIFTANKSWRNFFPSSRLPQKLLWTLWVLGGWSTEGGGKLALKIEKSLLGKNHVPSTQPVFDKSFPIGTEKIKKKNRKPFYVGYSVRVLVIMLST